jgi:hypothetical protein
MKQFAEPHARAVLPERSHVVSVPGAVLLQWPQLAGLEAPSGGHLVHPYRTAPSIEIGDWQKAQDLFDALTVTPKCMPAWMLP